ncbi:12334_t:CDS:1, partial [Acaulospora colombiana]
SRSSAKSSRRSLSSMDPTQTTSDFLGSPTDGTASSHSVLSQVEKIAQTMTSDEETSLIDGKNSVIPSRPEGDKKNDIFEGISF